MGGRVHRRTVNSPQSKFRFSAQYLRQGVSQTFRLAIRLGLFTAAAMVLTSSLHAADTTNGTPTILVVEPGDFRPTFLDSMSRLRQALTTNLSAHVVIYRENLGFSHFGGASYRADLESWLRNKYHGRKLDVIVASGESSIDFILKVRPKLWPQVPVLAVGTKAAETKWLAGQTNVCGIAADIDIPATLKAALQLCPGTRRIVFVSSSETNIPEVYGSDFEKVRDFSANRFELIPLVGLTMDETKQRLAALPPNSIVFYDDIWTDAAGQIFVPRDALEELSSASRAPIFSYSDSYIGYGMAGGACIANRTLVTEAASRIAAIIRAGSASPVPDVQSADSRLIFDWRQLHRYGLDEKNIPPGSEVRFRQYTFWESYHQVVIIATALLLVQSLLIAALLVQRRRQQRTETELFNSRQMLQTVLDTIPQRVFWKDRNSVFLGCNQRLADDCGYSHPNEVVGKTDYETISTSEADRYRADDREVMETDRPKLNFEEPQSRKDGSVGWLRTNKVPLHDEKGRVIGVLGTYENITVIKQANEALRESEQRFRSLVDNAPDAIYVQTNKRMAYTNRATLRLLRAEHPEQLLGRPVLDFVAPEWREVVNERMQQSNTKDGPLPALEEEYLRLDQSRVAVEVSAVPVIFQGDKSALIFVRDISERRRMDEKVRQLSRAVEQSPVSIVITDKAGNIEYVNRKFTEVTGYSFTEAIGKNPRILKSGELPPEVYRQMWESIRDGREWHGEFHNRKKNGELFWELAVISPVFNAGGTITHYLAVKEDITGRKQLEEQLRQSQKMEAFGQLAGGVAHDFNNILTVIEGNVALLQLQEPLLPDQAGSLVEIAKAAERAANLTRQLLTFSRRQLFQPKTLDLNEVVANTTKMLQRLIGEHIGLETHFAPGGAPITADCNMMEQILLNLAVNSRDAMPKGGRLIIRTDTVTFDETDAQANPKARPGIFIRLTVTDTGCGISQDGMEHIFEPFFTTKEVGKGTGLGLATVFGIVAQHGGWIEVKSKPDEGTTFYIYLLRLAEGELALAELAQPPDVRGGSETILLVEDEAPVRSLARTLLQRKGYHILEADSGVSALKIWQEQHAMIDLLFTDMVMPGGISGRDLAFRLQAEKPELKVIYSSGYTDDMLGEGSPLRNNPNFLEKPFDAHKLLKRVRDCLDEVSDH